MERVSVSSLGSEICVQEFSCSWVVALVSPCTCPTIVAAHLSGKKTLGVAQGTFQNCNWDIGNL